MPIVIIHDNESDSHLDCVNIGGIIGRRADEIVAAS